MNAVVNLNFEGWNVRHVIIDGEPWFVARDVAQVLGYSNLSDAVSRHCKGVVKRYPLASAGGTQESRVIAESDVMRLIVSSKLPAAEQFERWLFEEVLPELRRTGSYGAPKSLEQRSLELIGDLNTEVRRLTHQIERDAPKVEYVDTFIADNDVRLLRFVAQQLGLTESQLRNDLIDRGWIYKEHQRRRNSRGEVVDEYRYSAYSHKATYFDPVPNHQAPLFKGNLMHTLKITPPGAVAIARLYGKHIQAVEDVA